MSGTKIPRGPARAMCAGLLAIALSAGAWVDAWALDPAQQVSQYARTAWRLEEGSFSGIPRVVTQTADGYLWIGTSGGLVRFDGVRFVPLATLPGEHLRSPDVRALLPARDGSLWIGTSVDVEHLDHGHLTTFDVLGSIDGLAQDADGSVWVTRQRVPDGRGPLCRIQGSAFECFGQEAGIPARNLVSMAATPAGDRWLASGGLLERWHAGHATAYRLPALAAQSQDGIDALAPARDGSVWVGSLPSGPGLGLMRFAEGHWSPVEVPGLLAASLQVTALLVDRHDVLWIGTAGQGLYRLHDGRVDHLGSADGLASDTVSQLFEDGEGSLWVATSKGLERLRDLRVTSFTSREGLSQDSVDAVLASRDGSIWIENFRGLDHLRDGRVTTLQLPRDLPGHMFTSLMEDSAGRLWAGIDDGMVIFDGAAVRHVASMDGKPLGTVVGLTQDTAGDAWLSTIGGGGGRRLLRVRDARVQEELTGRVPPGDYLVADPKGGFWLAGLSGDLVHRSGTGVVTTVPFHRARHSGLIHDLLVTPDGAVIGASSAGVVAWRDGVSRTMTIDNGLPCSRMNSLAQDRAGVLWLYTSCGLVAIAPEELRKWWLSQGAVLKVRVFDAADGVQAARSDFSPQTSRSTDGRLWFTNGSVVQTVDPARLAVDTVVPPVHVEGLTADGRHYGAATPIGLEPRARDIEIDYTAPSFAMAQRVRFKYRLEGHDDAWQDAGTRCQAFFTDLPPGAYRFDVIASNDDGVWNDTGATLAFTLPPTFTQTRGFLVLCVAAVLLLAWLLVRARIRQVAARLRLRFDERVAERERIARELHDTLLQSTQGLILVFQGVSRRLAPGSQDRAALEQAVALADSVTAEGRNRVQDLRIPADSPADLAQGFSDVGRQLELTHAARLTLAVAGSPRAIVPEVGDEVFRIGREGLINAFRHARATSIRLELDYGASEFVLRLQDDGIGLDPRVASAGEAPGHWGLRGMRERAEGLQARFTVRSVQDGGTHLALAVPAAKAYAGRGRPVASMRSRARLLRQAPRRP